ncbi:hypothetical protein BDY19DRAFT_495828 [Irpex rosettiformis]|uniref:Uncharacterized protein n=1 Tax=Irpex rosettiformis TaxID=378272 RepID=A0ACB8UES5_9APHY|nr:hypothetical protein BDY19DRAFT_495828 [Irpex rosettiformis]
MSVISHPSVHQAPSAISREIPDLVNTVPSVKVPKAKLGPRLIAIPDKDLMRLRKCVSCELSWTSRKTAPQKMKHIQTCAKKNKLDSHTVTTLVRAELEKVEEDEKKNAKVSVVNTDLITVTLLENAVQEVISKKKGRRPKVIESVKQLSDTRQNILERARLLLQSQSSSAVPVGDPVAGPSALMSPPPTQPFGESTLAYRYQSRVSPDPTQPLLYIPSPPKAANGFGESNLAKQFSVKAHYLDHSSSPVHIPSPLAQRNRGLDSAHLSPTPRRLDLHEGADLMLGLGGEYTDNPVSVTTHPNGISISRC